MAKNTHLEHLEDDILNNGSDGGKNAIAFLRELGDMLQGKQSQVRITTKWDGAPAVICGIDPITGYFFVGTKSVFAKTAPKVMFSAEQIDETYSGQLAAKLKACLQYLPKLGIKGVLQGDLLFTDDKSSDTIDGERMITFTPNTITYAVPADSDLGSKINSAEVGIVFHTKYTGQSLPEMSASFGVDISDLNDSNDVYAATASFSDATGVAKFSPSEIQKFKNLVNISEGSLKKASKFLNILGETGSGKFLLSTLFKQFFNSYVRPNKTTGKIKRMGTPRAVVADFARYYKELLDKEIQSKKTTAAQDKYRKIQSDGLKFIQANQQSIYFTVASYTNLTRSKEFIIRKLEKVKTLGTFLRTETGYKVTAPEGFVAIGSGSALKLVDRLEFSRANFTATKDWDTTPQGYKGVTP